MPEQARDAILARLTNGLEADRKDRNVIRTALERIADAALRAMKAEGEALVARGATT